MAGIVLPFFNGFAQLSRCLRSFVDSAEGRHRFYLVDDASAAEERRAVEELCRSLGLDFRLLRHRSNRGYKESIRTGIAASREELILLLNSDTVLTPAFDRRLLDAVASASVAAAAPVSNHPTDLYQYRPELAIPPEESADGLAAAVERRARRAAAARPRRTPAPYLTGMCLAIDRGVLNRVGVFHDEYRHGYFEDLALCCEIRELGLDLLVCEDCFVYHQGHATYGRKTQEEKARIVDHNFKIFSDAWGHLPEHAELVAKMEYAGKVSPL